MVIWFAALAVLIVAIVFKSPAVDYRFVILGALLPLIEVVLGGPRLLHSVVGAVAVLVLVGLATQNRRLLRRRLLGIPIGMMCHLVLDGSFTRKDVFWWPIGGLEFSNGQIPELSHLGVSIVLELIGIAIAVWAWRLFGLQYPAKRARFMNEGRLDLPAD